MDLTTKITVNCVAYLYPVYQSYKSIRSKDVRLIVPWTMYWCILGVFTAVEPIVDLLLVWMLYFNGHIYMYKNILHPTLKHHEGTLDSMFKQWVAQVIQYFTNTQFQPVPNEEVISSQPDQQPQQMEQQQVQYQKQEVKEKKKSSRARKTSKTSKYLKPQADIEEDELMNEVRPQDYMTAKLMK